MTTGDDFAGLEPADGDEHATAAQILGSLFAEVEDILSNYSTDAINKLLNGTDLIRRCNIVADELTNSEIVTSLDLSRGMAAAERDRQKKKAARKSKKPKGRSAKTKKRKKGK